MIKMKTIEQEIEHITCDYCKTTIYRDYENNLRSCEICKKHVCDRCGPHDVNTIIVVCEKCREGNVDFIDRLLLCANHYDRTATQLEKNHEEAIKCVTKEYQSTKEDVLYEWRKKVETAM